MHLYRRKAIAALLVIMLIFFVIFAFAFYNLSKEEPIMNIGLPYYTEDYLVMFLSFASIIKAVIEITKVEHKDAYERRMKQGLDKTRG